MKLIKVYFLYFVTLCVSSLHSQTISENARIKLANVIQQYYALHQMDGASVHKMKGHKILVAIASVKQRANMQRLAQLKATNIAGEFLRGASNHAIAIYETTDNNTYRMDDKSIEGSYTHNSASLSEMNQKTIDNSFIEKEEKFSERIIQESLTRISNMEALTQFAGENGMRTFAYFILLK